MAGAKSISRHPSPLVSLCQNARVFLLTANIWPAVEMLGRVERESQSGEEVTRQHEDLVARLKNCRDTEQRLRQILQQRTGNLSDVLEVEEEIGRVRGEIDPRKVSCLPGVEFGC